MLSEDEIKEVEKLAVKNEQVKKLLDFYLSNTEDGSNKLALSFSKFMGKLADHVDKWENIKDIKDEDLSKIEKCSVISKNFKTITGGAKKEEETVSKHKKHSEKVIL